MTKKEIIDAFELLHDKAHSRAYDKYFADKPNKRKDRISLYFDYTDNYDFVFYVSEDYEGRIDTQRVTLSEVETSDEEWNKQIQVIKDKEEERLKLQQKEYEERKKQSDLNNLAALKAKYE